MKIKDKWKKWFARVGWLGFSFFLIKGILWLSIPYLISQGLIKCE